MGLGLKKHILEDSRKSSEEFTLMKTTSKTYCAILATLLTSASAGYADTFSVRYTIGAGGMSKITEAESFSDAKAIVESENKACVVYQVQASEPPYKTVDYMSLDAAAELARSKNK
jgi:hypothetical protein